MDEDKIINAILDLSANVEKMRADMLTKTDGRSIQHILEGHTTMMKNIQEDHLFSIEWIKRMQDDIEKHSEEIQRLKIQLKSDQT